MIPPYLARTFWLPLTGLESLTYGVRSQSAGADSFTSYTLTKVQRLDVSFEELIASGADLSYTWTKFLLFAVDLENANAPAPVQGYTLTESSGAVWFIWLAKLDTGTGQYEVLARKNLT